MMNTLIEYLSVPQWAYVWRQLLEGDYCQNLQNQTCKGIRQQNQADRSQRILYNDEHISVPILEGPSFRKNAKQMWTAMPLRTVFEYLGYRKNEKLQSKDV